MFQTPSCPGSRLLAAALRLVLILVAEVWRHGMTGFGKCLIGDFENHHLNPGICWRYQMKWCETLGHLPTPDMKQLDKWTAEPSWTSTQSTSLPFCRHVLFAVDVWWGAGSSGRSGLHRHRLSGLYRCGWAWLLKVSVVMGGAGWDPMFCAIFLDWTAYIGIPIIPGLLFLLQFSIYF